jgi:hypothetical protein
MRRLFFFVAVLASACTSSPVRPTPQGLAGIWAETFSIPGPSLVLMLDATGNGQGTYIIEAGRSGVVQVSGTTAGSKVTLTIQYDYGPRIVFAGSLTDADHLVGTLNDQPGTVTFSRRAS